MTKHTPAPWRVSGQKVTDQHGNQLYSTRQDHSAAVWAAPDNYNCQERRVKLANARLIAEAPAMLDALRELLPCVEGYADRADAVHEMLPKWHAILRRIGGVA